MYPWIDLYIIKIPSFGLMVAFAFLICNHLLKTEFPKNGLDSKIADDIIFYSIISAIIGSKFYHIIESGSFLQLYYSFESIIINIFSLNFQKNGLLQIIVSPKRFQHSLSHIKTSHMPLLNLECYIYRQLLKVFDSRDLNFGRENCKHNVAFQLQLQALSR